MYSLVLDSGNVNLVVGLAKDSKVIAKTVYGAWQKQSELMIPEIDKILKENSVDPKDIGEILVTKGPGSYTGVRIALTIAKVYSLALKIKCYAFSSLKVLQKEDVPSICLINARSGRSYFGVYKNNEEIIGDTIYTNEEVKNYINEHSDYALCGSLSYLNLDGGEDKTVENMVRLKNEKDLVENVLTLKAVYMKD